MEMPRVDVVAWYNRLSAIPGMTALWDRAFWQVVPFNRLVKPHVLTLTADEVVAQVRLRRSTMNHLRCMHASVLFTAGEYAQGLLIIANAGQLGAEVILRNFTIDYVAKARGNVLSRAEMTPEMRSTITEGLARGENPELTVTSTLTDEKSGAVVAVCKGVWRARRPRANHH